MENEPFEARRLPWKNLAAVVNVPVYYEDTIRSSLQRRKPFHKRIEQIKQPLPPVTAKARVQRAHKELVRFSDPKVWRKYFAADETHFSYGP